MPRTAQSSTGPAGLTLAQLAEAKSLPLEFLRDLGLFDDRYERRPAVAIPYFDASGHEVALRYRTSLEGKERFRWRKGDHPTLYGLDRLAETNSPAALFLVEGESDAWTLWHHGFSAVGIPGVGNWPEDEASALAGIPTLYVVDERDPGAPTLLGALARSPVRDRVRVIHFEGVKDPSELHLANPSRFVEALSAACAAAVSLEERAGELGLPYGDATGDSGLAPASEVAGEGWERPARLDLEDNPPHFPTEALPDWMRIFVDAVAEATQTPADLAGMLALATVATVAAGPILVAPAPDWREGINIFVAVAMEPGSRKSAVFKEVTRPVSAYEQGLAGEMGPEIARAAARRRVAEKRLAHLELQAAKAGPDERLPLEADCEVAAVALERLIVPPEPRLFTSDVTSEALGSLLSDHGGRFAVLSPEGGVFDQMAGLYNKGLPNPDVFLKGHAGDTIRVDRRGRPSEYVERPALTLCLAVQPNSLVAVHGNPSLSGRGLLERFLFSVPQGMVGRRTIDPPSVAGETRARYESAIEAIARFRDGLNGPVVLTLTPAAAQRFSAFRTELEHRRGATGDLTYIATWASKLDGATARLAGLLHVAEHFANGVDRPINAATMEAAIRLARYLIPHARVAFDRMGADIHRDDAREVLEWLRRKDLRTFTRRQAFRALQGRFPNVAALNPALDLLEAHGWIRDVQQSPRPGRPSIAYDVTPYLYDVLTELTEPAGSPALDGFVSSVPLSLEATFKPPTSLPHVTGDSGNVDGYGPSAYLDDDGHGLTAGDQSNASAQGAS